MLVGFILIPWLPTLGHTQPLTIPVKEIKGPIPQDASNPVWEGAPAIDIPLNASIGPAAVKVRVVTNGREIGVWMSWLDPTNDDVKIDTQDYPDQAAVIFGSKSNPREAWTWDAEWQKKSSRAEYLSSPAFDQSPEFTIPPENADWPDRIGRSLGPFAPTTLYDETIARKTEKPRCPKAQEHQFQCTPIPVGGQGMSSHSQRSWTVVFHRALNTSDLNNIQFHRGETVSVGFGIWDGSKVQSAKMTDVSCCYGLKIP